MLSAIIITAPFVPFEELRAQQPFEQWLSPHSVQTHYKQGRSAVDDLGSVYQAGATINDDGLYEAMLSKIDRNGVLQWTYSYTAPSGGQSSFTDVALMNDGSVALCGVSINASQSASTCLIAKLEPVEGDLEWIETYSHSGSVYNGATSLSTDGFALYVAGITYNLTTLSDMLVMKYDGDGDLQWARRRDFFGLQDGAVKLVYNNGEVLVTGGAQYQSAGWHYGTLKYKAADGILLTSYLSGNSMSSIDAARDMVLDASGNIYITGSETSATQDINMYTAKLSASLELIWDHSYNFSGSNKDVANAIALLPSGQVLITGYTDFGGGNTQFTSVMYSNAGAVMGNLAYDISTKNDTALVVATDVAGNVYVSGTFYNGSNQDVKTIKYSNMGVLKWEIDYNGIDNGDDTVLDMVHDGDDLIVMVQSQTPEGRGYRAIKYSESDFVSPQYAGSSQLGHAFSRNNGQLTNEFGDPVTDIVPYYARTNGSFYRTDGIDYLSASLNGDSTLNDTIQKIALDFYNMHSTARMAAFDKAAYFENHYVPHAPHKLERIPHYGRLLYINLWEGVDMETRFGQGHEYHFRVTDKGRITNIAFEALGADTIFINASGDAVLRSFNRDIVLPAPRVYQTNSTGQLIELSWSPYYTYSNGILRIDGSGSIDGNKDMWVRISRGDDDIPQTDGFCHSTYFGGFDNERAYDMAINNVGKMWICGELRTYSFYPQDVPIMITNIGSPAFFSKAYVTCFTEDFIPQYMTIISGNSNVNYYSVSVKGDTQIAIGGRSEATNMLIENLIGANYVNSSPWGGAGKSFLSLIGSDNGELQYNSYFGGTGSGTISQVEVDSQGRVYIVGSTNVYQDFPIETPSGTYSNISFSTLNGESNGYLARFTPEMDLDWSVLIGGSDRNRVSAIAVGSDDRIAIAGATRSTDIDIELIQGTIQETTFNGPVESFLMVFNSSGQRIWSTIETLGTTNNLSLADRGIFGQHTLAFDGSNNLYFAFETPTLEGINLVDPGGNSFFLENDAGLGQPYLISVKFSHTNFAPIWRTQLMLADNGNVSRVNNLLVHQNKMALCGYSRDPSMDVVQIDPSLYAAQLSDQEDDEFPFTGTDGFFMIFETNEMELLHSSYFGGTGSNFISTQLHALGFNDSNDLFGCGYTSEKYNTDNLNVVGIPVKNNSLPNNYYQSNLAEFADVFGFRMCFDGTPLDVEESKNVVYDSSNELMIYPNPVFGGYAQQLSVKASATIERIYIHSLEGKLLKFFMPQQNQSIEMDVEIHGIPQGIYLLTAETSVGRLTSKLIILK